VNFIYSNKSDFTEKSAKIVLVKIDLTEIGVSIHSTQISKEKFMPQISQIKTNPGLFGFSIKPSTLTTNQ